MSRQLVNKHCTPTSSSPCASLLGPVVCHRCGRKVTETLPRFQLMPPKNVGSPTPFMLNAKRGPTSRWQCLVRFNWSQTGIETGWNRERPSRRLVVSSEVRTRTTAGWPEKRNQSGVCNSSLVSWQQPLADGVRQRYWHNNSQQLEAAASRKTSKKRKLKKLKRHSTRSQECFWSLMIYFFHLLPTDDRMELAAFIQCVHKQRQWLWVVKLPSSAYAGGRRRLGRGF